MVNQLVKYTFIISLLLMGAMTGGEVGFFSTVHAQNVNKLEREGKLYFLDEHYWAALPKYKQLHTIQPDNPRYTFKLGVCYLYASGRYNKALQLVRSAHKNKNLSPYVHQYYYYMGQAYHLNYAFDTAQHYYKKSRHRLNRQLFDSELLNFFQREKVQLKEQVELQIKMCRNAKKVLKDTTEVRLTVLDTPVNTRFQDYAPTLPPDGSVLIFTSRRPGSKGGRRNIHGFPDKHGRFFEDIYITQQRGEQWSEPVGISNNINTEGHDASVNISSDQQTLLLYRNDKNQWGDLYKSTKEANTWQEPQRMEAPVNTKDYWEGSACFTVDGQTLYFVSNRPGGEGGRDIYKTSKQGLGEWSTPQNLGPVINSPQHEEAPFIDNNETYLYFSSKGHNSIGGYDIFRAKKTEEGWASPENMGYPVNSTGDDIYFVQLAESNQAYFSSARAAGKGAQDIYSAIFPRQRRKADVIAYVTGKVQSDKQYLPATIRVVDSSGAIHNQAQTDSNNVFKVAITRAGRYKLMVSPQDYVFESSSFSVSKGKDTASPPHLQKEVDLHSDSVQQRLVLRKIFFKPGRVDLSPSTRTQLDELIALIQRKASLKLHIMPKWKRAEDKDTLYQKREAAVRQYLVEKKVSDEDFYIGKTVPKDWGDTISTIKVALLEGNLRDYLTQSKLTERLVVKTDFDFPRIYFDFDKAVLSGQAKQKLDSVYQYLKTHKALQIEIAGHTDTVGSKTYNQRLSEKRADAVARYLHQKGIKESRYTIKGYGKSLINRHQYSHKGTSREGRRVEFNIYFGSDGADPLGTVQREITLEQSYSYSIFNSYEKIVKEGQGRIIDVTSLPEGVYYLEYDNKRKKFLKQ